MPNRILKESICTSDNLDTLSAFHETVFYRLIVNVDDYGRMDARPKILAARLFPLKDIRASQMEDALRALTSAELVILYTVDGKPFLQMKTWDRHQTVRATKSRYPSPEDGEITSASTCMQLQADTSECSRNPNRIRNRNPNPNPNPNAHARADGGMFDKFWAAYPKKQGKQQAEKAFAKLNPDPNLLLTMLESIGKWSQSQQWTKDGGQFIPMPATWLNGKRWEDEAPTVQGNVTAQQYTQRMYTEEELEDRSAMDALLAEAAGL